MSDAARSELGGPRLAARFRVTIDGAEIGVARVGGLGLAGDPARLARSEAGSWTAPPLPTRLTLCRALDGDRRLHEWRREAVRAGEKAARRVVIRQLDADGRPLDAWSLTGWPLAWTGPELDANSGGLAWETLEVVADDVTWLEEA